MPNVPNYNDLQRQQRIALDNNSSYKAVMQRMGNPQSILYFPPAPVVVPDYVVFELAGTNISFNNFGWTIQLDSSTGYVTISSTDAFGVTVRNQSNTTSSRFNGYINYGDRYSTGWNQTHSIRITATSTDSNGKPAGYITRLYPAAFTDGGSTHVNNLSSMNVTRCNRLQDIILDSGSINSTAPFPIFSTNSSTLSSITLTNNIPVQQLHVANCASLENIICTSVPYLSSVQATGCNNLKTFVSEGNINMLSAVDLTGATGLQFLVMNNPTYLSAYESTIINNLITCALQFDGTEDTTSYTRKTSAFCVGSSMVDLQMYGLNLANADHLFPSNNLMTLAAINGNTLRDITISNKSQLSALYVYGCTSLSAINISNCSALYEVDVGSNNLNVTNLNAIYTALPDRTGRDTGNIYVYDNPGAFSSNAALATVKNWTVIKT